MLLINQYEGKKIEVKRVTELTVPLGKRRLHQLLLTEASMPVRSASSTTMMNTTTTMPESAQYHLARLLWYFALVFISFLSFEIVEQDKKTINYIPPH